MKVFLIILGSLLALFLVSIGIACCRISGDAEEDAERCFEEWLKSKQEEPQRAIREGVPHDLNGILYK